MSTEKTTLNTKNNDISTNASISRIDEVDSLKSQNEVDNVKLQNEKITFLELCKVFEEISKTSKRLEIQQILANFFKKCYKEDKNSFYIILHLCTAKIYPEYKNLEMGVGDFILLSCVSEATGLTVKSLKSLLIKTGDLGNIACENRVKQLFISKKRLLCEEIFIRFRDICHFQGLHSTKVKKIILLKLINLSSPLETKYLIRLAEGKLKIGLALATILTCLGKSFDLKEPQKMKDCYNKNPDFESLLKVINLNGVSNLDKIIKITPGIPLKPMLAAPISNISKAFSKFGNCLAEYKYDGERIQIHNFKPKKEGDFHTENDNSKDKDLNVGNAKDEEGKKDKKDDFNDGNVEDKRIKFTFDKKEENIVEGGLIMKTFSRNLESTSDKYPDIVELKISNKTFIMDAEVVAFSDGKIQPFQLLATRKRKNVEKIEVSVCVFVFDILFFDGEELTDKSLFERRSILKRHFNEIPGKFMFAKSIESNLKGSLLNTDNSSNSNDENASNIEDLEEFFKNSILDNSEGCMIKDLNALYIPSFRSNKWLKLKKDYIDSLGDSMDLVVIGAYYGKGKRTGTYGGFLLGAYNQESDKYEACCKIGTGFSDLNLSDFFQRLTKITNNFDSISNLVPDVWIKPEFVWEVKAASMSLSPVYTAGNFENKKGISLRFPRFIRERPDKNITEATSTDQLKNLYYNEVHNIQGENTNDVDDDEFN